jgi:methylmalonyl-CoA mutase
MAEVSEYIQALITRGVSVDDAVSSIGITLSLSSNFFMEVAKIRAARALFAQIAADFGASPSVLGASIHAVTSSFNKSKLDAYTNALRLSTEAFSAVVGGVEALSVLPFDHNICESSAHSRRISRNICTMMAEEFNLLQPIDPAGGSYYIETLTNEFIDKAFAKFMEFENAGGFYTALKTGEPQKAIAASLLDKRAKMATRQLRAVGVNMYANAKEELPAALANLPHSAAKDTAVEPILPSRLFEDFENLRDKTVKLGGVSVLLLNMGPVAEHKGRSDFSLSFFETAGFNVISDKMFDGVDEAVAAVSSDIDICVICSTDGNYPQIVPAIAKSVKEKSATTQVILAGMPAPELKDGYFEAGLTDFIHIRSNVLDTLKSAQERIERKGGRA